jgi:hypothetical protein
MLSKLWIYIPDKIICHKITLFLLSGNAFTIIIMLFILTQMSFFPRREVNFFRVRNPVGGFFNFIKLILPGPGFEPVTSRVAGVGDALGLSAI